MDNLLHISALAVSVTLIGQFALSRIRSSASDAILLALPIGMLLGATSWVDPSRDGLFMDAAYVILALQSFVFGSRFKVADLVGFRRHWLWCAIAAAGFAMLAAIVYHFGEISTSHGLVAAAVAFFSIGLLGPSEESASSLPAHTMTILALVVAGVLCAFVSVPPVGMTPTELVVAQLGLGVCAGLLIRVVGPEHDWSLSATIAVILILTGVCVWTQTPPLLAGVTAGLVTISGSEQVSRCDRLAARPIALALAFLCGLWFAAAVPTGNSLTVILSLVAVLVFHALTRFPVGRLVRPINLDNPAAHIPWYGLIGRGPAGLVVALGFSLALWEPLLVWLPVILVLAGEILVISLPNNNSHIDKGEVESPGSDSPAEQESLQEVPA